MANLEDFKERTRQLREYMLTRLPEVAETLTLSAKALAERRMKNEGFGVKYSGNPVPAWFFKGKELNQRGTKFLEQRGVNTTGKPKKKRRKKGDTDPAVEYPKTATWGEFRTAQGLQAAFVDLSYSNKMWANMAPVETKEVGGRFMCYLGATNREAQDKMNWNRARYGDFVRKALNEEDGKVLTDVVIGEVVNLLDNFQFK